jgi:hypothetical protein
VGLIPCSAHKHAEPPETILERCRAAIDQHASPEERVNLLAVTQVMTRLRYNDPKLLSILGGSQIMIESPLIQEVRHRDILMVLRMRFASVPHDIESALQGIYDPSKVDELLQLAASCPDIETFRAHIRRNASGGQ